MQEHYINCRGCQKPDKETLIGKSEECHICEGTGCAEDGMYNLCTMCNGEGIYEYIPKTSEHYWARCDSYGIYTGLYCDNCYKNNYPYKKNEYFDESHCGESMDSED